jgi:hypothetical protein
MPGELATAGKKVLANPGQPNWLSRVGTERAGERVESKKKKKSARARKKRRDASAHRSSPPFLNSQTTGAPLGLGSPTMFSP